MGRWDDGTLGRFDALHRACLRSTVQASLTVLTQSQPSANGDGQWALSSHRVSNA